MNAVEFVVDLAGGSTLQLPPEIVAQLPVRGRARVILLTESDPDDRGWRVVAYDQFVREDPPEDAIYDSLR